jgi:hypothetical protein
VDGDPEMAGIASTEAVGPEQARALLEGWYTGCTLTHLPDYKEE